MDVSGTPCGKLTVMGDPFQRGGGGGGGGGGYILKLKQLELKRSSNIEAYTFLAVILPLPPPDFDLLKRAVGMCRAVWLSHFSVNSSAKRQNILDVRSVEALEDVRSQASSFRNTRLMVSFTLSILKYTPADSICPKFGPISWICNSMRRFPGLNFGVALYNLEDDDSSRTSCLNASTESRLPAVSNYFRKFASKPEFGTTKNVDCGDLLSNVGTDG
ncbi:hypothetical protein HPB47_015672 [Ixodes persulcatus]|uniref:Uncharacterized protein n=1 Tax=Ixodes persulcatus TaxID=34615 RepID=A0AC60QWD9_IXOPE|nr:hypothetical protein HPB47_015672 [Ixodes persulcatus]